MSRTARTLILLMLVLAVASWLRLWRIDAVPPGFHFDEAFEGLEAWRILTNPSYRPIFLTGNFGVPPLNAYANAVSFAVAEAVRVEPGPTVMRVTAALFGLLGVLALYALGVELQRLRSSCRQISHYFPLLAAASLGAMRWHAHFSRMGIEPVFVPLIWATAMWLLLVSWRTGRWSAYVMTAVAVALGMYAYQGAWIIPLLVAAAALHLLVSAMPQRRVDPQRWNRRMAGLLVIAILSFVLVLPLALFFAQNPGLFLLRPAQLAIVGETGSPSDSSVGSSLWAMVAMFAPFGTVGDLDPRRNIPGMPVLNIWQLLPFYVGLIVAGYRIRQPAYSIAIFGLVGLLLPGAVSEYAPHFHRVLGAAAPTALFCGLGLDWTWQRIAMMGASTVRRRQWANAAGGTLVVALLVGAVVTSGRDYFGRWAAMPDLFYAFDEGLWQIGQATYELARSMPVYITPEGSEHATIAFAWRNRVESPANLPTSFDGRHIFPLTDGSVGSSEVYAVIEHEDFRTRLLLPEVFPDAKVETEYLDGQGEVYARTYERIAGSVPARPPAVNSPSSIGDGMRIIGYDVLPADLIPGGSLYVQLHWSVGAPPKHDWTVFVHIVDPLTGQVVAGYDSRPGAGSLPTSSWKAGWRILDEYEIHLPVDIPPAEYDLYMGLYGGDEMRLPLQESGVHLGSVTIR